MLHSLAFAVSVVIVVLGCASLGGYLRRRVPAPHLADDSRSIAMAGIGLLVTMASLAMSLLLSESKSRFDTLTSEVRDVAVKLVLFDSELRDLGPAGAQSRADLRSFVAARIEAVWRGRSGPGVATHDVDTERRIAALRRALQAVHPENDEQRLAKARALQLEAELRQVRLITQANQSSEIVAPFLVLIVLWFAIIVTALNVFAPRNGTIRTLNLMAALSIGGAIFLILEMDDPFGGMIRISDAPLRSALLVMQD
jgi:hypothetical protein